MKTLLLTLFISSSLLTTAYSQINIDTSSIVKNDRQLYSVVVSQDDKLIYDQYFNGKNSGVLFNNQSLTKSVCSLLIGIAIDKGYISSVDEKLVKFFPELKQETDKRKQDITIRQVMNQASGLWHEDLTRLGIYLKLPDPSGYILNAPLVSEPGKEFHYNNAASHLLSVIITKSTGMSTLDFANKYLFAPLGITDVKWNKMNDGYYDGSGLLSVQTHTQDMNRIGALLLHKGYFNGKSVVPEKWIDQILHPTAFSSFNAK